MEEIEDIENKEVDEIVKKVRRTIINDKPRVTKFDIEWEDKQNDKFNERKGGSEESQSRLEDYFPTLLRK